jgi:transcriptional regulator with XRE-family HTH domain
MARPSQSSKTGSSALARVIRERRKELGLSRHALAEATGVPYPTIAQIETAYRGVSPSRLGVIARVLGLDPKDLYDLLAGETAEPPSGPPPGGWEASGSSTAWRANPAYLAASAPPSTLPATAAPSAGPSGPPAPAYVAASVPPPALAPAAAAAPPATAPFAAAAPPATPTSPTTAPSAPVGGPPPAPSADLVDHVVALLAGLPAEERLEALSRVQTKLLSALVDEQVQRATGRNG